jgi:hypothetical protein
MASGFLEKNCYTKIQGGWGIKNPFLFSKALVAKNVWHLLQGTGLWAQTIKDKYLPSSSIEDWIHSPNKKTQTP